MIEIEIQAIWFLVFVLFMYLVTIIENHRQAKEVYKKNIRECEHCFAILDKDQICTNCAFEAYDKKVEAEKVFMAWERSSIGINYPLLMDNEIIILSDEEEEEKE